MHYRDGKLIFSPTDLSRWSASPYASWIARLAVEDRDAAPQKDPEDPLLVQLASRGLAHEDALETRFREAGLDVVNVATRLRQSIATRASAGADDAAHAITVELLQAGTDVIAQASLVRGPFRGQADFLVRMPGESALGDFHYEVWDTKLARRVKPGMVLQLCCYVDMLEMLQGRRANDLVVALGSGSNQRVALTDCFDYYLANKRAFLAAQSLWSKTAEPDPADFSDHGQWSDYATSCLEARDHLSRVARITRRQIERLTAGGVTTMTELSQSAGVQVAGIDPNRMSWLVQQAALQCASATLARPAHVLLDASSDSERGLTALPAASPKDVFFDIEGFPLEGEGLEYLWGCTYMDAKGQRAFRDWWAHDTRAEQRAFEGFIDWVYERWKGDPRMHIYHYAPYEITACKRLMGTYGTRENELDELLRNHVFVDLYAIVTHGIQIGEPRYSIKNVERLYRSGRDTDVASGGDSVVVYDQWRDAYQQGNESGLWQESSVLEGIRDYNRDDCDSTLELCEWLRAQCPNPVAPANPSEVIESELSDAAAEVLALAARLLVRADDAVDEGERMRLRTLAGVLEFHRRENKTLWWRYFERMDPANTSLADDASCLADARRSSREGYKHSPRARNLAWEYTFDTRQELKGLSSSMYVKGMSNAEGKVLSVRIVREDSDLEAGRVVLQSKLEPPAVVTLVPNEMVGAEPIPGAIAAVVGDIEAGKVTRSALLDLLARRPPRLLLNSGEAIVRTPATALQDTIRAVLSLDDSCLVIQGPPGAGKSYTGARIIAALVAEGRRVGIASNSHKAINNLMSGTAGYCLAEGIDAHLVKGGDASEDLEAVGVTFVKNAGLAAELREGCVLGATAWGFARAELANELDVLVIDEAGQVALANVVGMSRAARNLVLMGDQRQLGQPTQGSHPAESGMSVLDYLLGDTAAVTPERGVFLGTTYRMHPAVNALVSRHVYSDRLETAPVTQQRTLLPADVSGALDVEAGVVFMPVEHVNNEQSSDEEVFAIVAAVRELEQRQLRTEAGALRRVSLDDMLFVAPYNAQAEKLSHALGARARVGSVDRFQGQEAPIVFLSLCTSDAAASPRGLSFLFDRNRLNVAVSRAQTLCVIVGHPKLAITPVATLADLKRVNFVAALMADGDHESGTGASSGR